MDKDLRLADALSPPGAQGSSGSMPAHGLSAISADSHGPGTKVDLAAQRRRLSEVLMDLPERFQTIVLWRFFAGAEWSEIAEAVKSPSADAVKMECLLKVLPAIAAGLARRDDLPRA